LDFRIAPLLDPIGTRSARRNGIRIFGSGDATTPRTSVNQTVSIFIAPIGFAYISFFESLDHVLKSQHETALLIRGAIPSFIGDHNL